MAKNEKLKEIVLEAIYNHLKKDPKFRSLGGNDIKEEISIIDNYSKIHSDENHKIRLLFGNLIGYGYDFGENDRVGNSAFKMYKNAIEKTKIISGNPCFETFIAEGIADGNFGWYITEV